MKKYRDVEVLKEDLRSHVDLVQFIGRYVELTARGQRYVGFCPFHDDKNNPGFGVSPDTVYQATGSRGVWACWSCDARGDLFGFVQRIHDVTFFEAIELIAEITKFDLAPYYRTLSPEEQRKEQLYDATAAVAELFSDALLNSEKKLKFYTDRGIGPDILWDLKVGWCPSFDFLRSKLDADVINLIEPRIGNRARLFADRLLYTQFTTTGRPWGWSARQPDDRPHDVPKYVGTSQDAPLFDGLDRLYGFAQARKLLRKSKLPLLIVEGFHDALAAQQADFAAVAACGTALSAKQIETLQTHSIRKAQICLDPDEGGRKGMFEIAKRAHEVHGIQFEFIDVPSEPEEFIFENGPDAFRDCLGNGLGSIEYIVSRHSDLDTSTATKKRDFLDHIRPYLTPYPRRSLDRALGVQAVAGVTRLPEEVISDYLDERSDSPLSNLTGELIVLAELAINPQAWVTLTEVTADDFSLKRYRQTYLYMLDLYNSEAEVNVELLLTHAHNQGAPTEIMEVISKLGMVTRKTPDYFAKDIRDKAVRRRAQEFSEVMGRQVGDLRSPVNESVARFIEDITHSMTARNQRLTYSSAEAVTLLEQEIERRLAATTGIAGLDMGSDWDWLIAMLNGHRAKRVNLIAAASNVGKSLVWTNWLHKLSVAVDFGLEERPAPQAAGLIVSMEMTPEEVQMRLAAIEANVPHLFIDRWAFDSEEQGNLVYAAIDRIKTSRLTWMTGQRKLSEINMQARLLQARGELDYIALDYVQLLDLTQYPDRWSVTEKYGQASQDMHMMAETLNVPIIACAQLNRSSMGEDVPTGEQMGSSYKIYQDAHSCYILAPRGENGLHASLDKNRGSGKGHVALAFDTNPQTSTLRIYEREVLKRSASR